MQTDVQIQESSGRCSNNLRNWCTIWMGLSLLSLNYTPIPNTIVNLVIPIRMWYKFNQRSSKYFNSQRWQQPSFLFIPWNLTESLSDFGVSRWNLLMHILTIFHNIHLFEMPLAHKVVLQSLYPNGLFFIESKAASPFF